MSSSTSLDIAPSPGGGSATASVGAVTLPMSGGKPMQFYGELLAEGSSWTPGEPAWHEAALRERADGNYAVGLKVGRGFGGDSDLFHARVFTSRDDAQTWLQEFDPTACFGAKIDASNRRISTTDITLRAAALPQRADRVDPQYRALIGELLDRFDRGEQAAPP